MNIKEAIKEQIVISKLKKEAKIYHRQNNENTLMACQDKIAQNYGYRHWHEFHTNIKTNLLKYQNINHINTSSGLYIGKEKLSGNKTYLNSYFDQLNITTNEYSNGFIKNLSEQILNQNNSILVCIKDSKDPVIYNNLAQYAKDHNIKIYHLILDKTRDNDINKVFFDFPNYSSGCLVDLLLSQIDKKYEEMESFWKGKAISLISMLLSSLSYLNKIEKIKLTPAYLLNFLDLDNVIQLSQNEDLPYVMKAGLKKHINETLPGNDESNERKKEIHNYITRIFQEPLKKLIVLSSHLQSSKEKVSFSTILENQEKFMLLVDMGEQNEEESNSIVNYIVKFIIGDLNAYHGGDINKIYKNQQTHMKYCSYFITPSKNNFDFSKMHNPLRLSINSIGIDNLSAQIKIIPQSDEEIIIINYPNQ